jgi:enolase
VTERPIDIRAVMIVRRHAETFHGVVRMGPEMSHARKLVRKSYHLSAAMGNEGSFVSNLNSNNYVAKVIVEAIGKAGYDPGDHIEIGLDVAASELADKDGN